MAYARTRRRSRAAPARRKVRSSTYRRPARRAVSRRTSRKSGGRSPRQQVVRLEIIQAPVASTGANAVADYLAATRKEVKPKRARL